MKKIGFITILTMASTVSFAGLPEMMKIYNNPKSAPKVTQCKGNQNCNAFIALSKQWQAIPNQYRYQGEFDIKSYARKGVTYDNQGRNIGLQRGFYFRTEQTQALIDGTDTLGDISQINYEGGLAVLLYIEDKNGWVND